MPQTYRDCMASWKKYFPDYELCCWNEDTFDVDMNAYVHEAYALKKYNSVANVARCWALYNYGGIYFDTDILVYRNFEELFTHSFIAGLEYYEAEFLPFKHLLDGNHIPLDRDKIFTHSLGILAGALISIPQHSYMRDVLNYYDTHTVFDQEGKYVLLDAILAHVALSYGFQYVPCEQILSNDVKILGGGVFALGTYEINPQTVIVHNDITSSWRSKGWRDRWYRWLDKHSLLKAWRVMGRMKRKVLGKIKAKK